MVGGLYMRQTLTYSAAKIKDIPQLTLLAESFWEELSFHKEPFDDNSVIGILLMCIEADMIFVAKKGREIIGFIAAACGPLLTNKDTLTATEIAWWVEPKYRDTGAGGELIELLEASCKNKNVKYLNMVFLDQSMPKVIESFYKKKGYTRVETTYTKVIN